MLNLKPKKLTQKQVREQFSQLCNLKDYAECQLRKENNKKNQNYLDNVNRELTRIGKLVK